MIARLTYSKRRVPKKGFRAVCAEVPKRGETNTLMDWTESEIKKRVPGSGEGKDEQKEVRNLKTGATIQKTFSGIGTVNLSHLKTSCQAWVPGREREAHSSSSCWREHSTPG